ncbi:MAG: aldo/keto reductase [Magnetococcales bacterium]|nr:aldo/keto reductase [Magnetococcales bacterium]
MERRSFGATGVRPTVFTLGTMRFLHGWDDPDDHLPEDSLANAHDIIHAALGMGINHIETARSYGKSERLIGKVLSLMKPPRSPLILTSKGQPTETAGEMRRQLENSLERLGVDRLDLYALHGLNNRMRADLALRPGGCLAALQRARDEGLIGAIGFSSHAPLPLLLELIATGEFAFVNLHYNFFRQENRAAVALAASREMGVFIISPNEKGGWLYQPSPQLEKECHPLHPVHFNERWLLSQPEVHTLSIGPSLAQHLDRHRPSLEKRPYWGNAERRIQTRLNLALSGSPLDRCGPCNRCLPCPVRIDIPNVLRLEHLAQTLRMEEFGRFRYGMMSPDDHWIPGARGNLCDHCGDCLPRCPQELPIPELVHRAHDRFQR